MTGPYNTTPELRSLVRFSDKQLSDADLELFQSRAYALIDAYYSSPDTAIASSIEHYLVMKMIHNSSILLNNKTSGYELNKLEYTMLTKEMKRSLKAGKVTYGKKPIDGPNPGDSS